MTCLQRFFWLFLPLTLLGCGGGSMPVSSPTDPNLPIISQTLSGQAMDGQQAIAGAHVYLLAANTIGYGKASASLLLPESTGYSDSIGAYVLTKSDGSFSIPGTYSCPTGNSQVYIYLLGGNAGLGTNSAIGEMAAIGYCPSLTAPAVPLLVVNEVSTVAATYAMAGFSVDATHVSSSGTTLAQTGVANAFANATNLATLSTGTALTKIPSGNATVPQTTINLLANILAACIHSASSTSSACMTLLSNAQASGVEPLDTATAAINIAHSPATNVSALYALQTALSPFSPSLNTPPNDFSVGITFNFPTDYSDHNISIDSSGNVWYADDLNNEIVKLSSTGYFLSGASGYTDGLFGPGRIAIDPSDNVWVGQYQDILDPPGPYSLFEFSNSGQLLSGSGYTGGGLYCDGSIAMDAAGDAWVVNINTNKTIGHSVSKFSPLGVPLSGATGFTGGGILTPVDVAIDGTGNAWVGNLGAESNGAVSNLIKLSNGGSVLSGADGFTDGGTDSPYGVAVDSTGDVWAAYPNGATGSTGRIVKFSNSGEVLSGAGGYTGNGTINAYFLAIDGAGNVWSANSVGVAELSNSGELLSGSVGYIGGSLGADFSIAVDGSGDVWVTNASYTAEQLTELIGIATPVITPISAGLPATPTADGSSKLGTRP